ncbi:hypothetical protein [Nocardia altamirensis]|uniref:hypothetical protein n=1 Tax=Nocardia altamirensis TaxID=472158 RepID=UPI0008406AE3|nr:hypothetical protein [Nocardia altamirensis]
MSDTKTRRVAVVGIDGCGKSSVLARLRELAPPTTTFESFTCPDFHDTRNAPLATLSRQLKAMSDGADTIGNLQLKALALYLQMTLYGPVERFFTDTYRPAVLVCERHPLIETLVYGPFYLLLAGIDGNGAAALDELGAVLHRTDPGALDAITAWHAAEMRRLGEKFELWELLGEVADVVGADTADSVAALGARYRTTLPDAVLWLDVPPAQAAARCALRSNGAVMEAHETPEFLDTLRGGYLRTRDLLTAAFPELRFHTIDTSDGVDLDESVSTCVTEGRLFDE